MKDDAYTEVICKGFCKYYKPGKEELHCGGYEVLKGCCTPPELQALISLQEVEKDIKYTIPPEDAGLRAFVCEKCDFVIDGCDYSENHSGPPCGGYLLLRLLTARG